MLTAKFLQMRMEPISHIRTDSGGVASWPIFVNYKIECPWWWMGKSEERNISVTWNTAKTSITYAKLRYSASTESFWDVRYKLFFNGEKVAEKDIGGLNPKEVSGEQDVTSLLINGVNNVKVDTARLWTLPYDYTVVTTVTLEIGYTGEIPNASPPTTPFPWRDYLRVAAIGALAGGGAGLVLSLFYAPEKGLRDHAKNALVGAVGGAAVAVGVKYALAPY